MPISRDPYEPGPTQPTLFPNALDASDRREAAHPDHFQLRCDIEIYVESMTQTRTYGGMLEGFPNERVNDAIIESVISDLEERHGDHVHFIEPPITPRPEKEGFRGMPRMELPQIQCVTRFGSRSVGEFGSKLVVLWYQSHFAMPIDDYVLTRIHALDWPRLAKAIEDF